MSIPIWFRESFFLVWVLLFLKEQTQRELDRVTYEQDIARAEYNRRVRDIKRLEREETRLMALQDSKAAL